MIRIYKPATAPPKLTIDGKNKAAEHHAEYVANASDYQSNKKKFNFDSSIYNHSTVKDAWFGRAIDLSCPDPISGQ